jgi:hypothetical protein
LKHLIGGALESRLAAARHVSVIAEPRLRPRAVAAWLKTYPGYPRKVEDRQLPRRNWRTPICDELVRRRDRKFDDEAAAPLVELEREEVGGRGTDARRCGSEPRTRVRAGRAQRVPREPSSLVPILRHDKGYRG